MARFTSDSQLSEIRPPYHLLLYRRAEKNSKRTFNRRGARAEAQGTRPCSF